MSQRPGFTFCICPDSRLLREFIDTRTASSPPESGPEWEYCVHWGDEELGSRFWEQLTLQNLFGAPRILIVRNAQTIPAAVWKKISSALGNPNPQCWPFFCLEVPWEKGQPKVPAHIGKLQCLRFAESRKWIWRSAGLDARSVQDYIRKRGHELGIRFAPGAFEALCSSLPPDASSIDNELNKLALFGPEPVTPAMTDSAIRTPDFDIFSFLRLVQQGNPAAAWEQIRRGKKENDDILFPFLSLLAREARILWQLLVGESVRLPPSVASQKQQIARRLGPAGISRLFRNIVRTERMIKSGERSSEQALDSLVAELTALFI